jgi:hypothetical protein
VESTDVKKINVQMKVIYFFLLSAFVQIVDVCAQCYPFQDPGLPVDQRDVWDTYLPAFEKLIKTGHAYSVMCAYNRRWKKHI